MHDDDHQRKSMLMAIGYLIIIICTRPPPPIAVVNVHVTVGEQCNFHHFWRKKAKHCVKPIMSVGTRRQRFNKRQ